MMRLMPEWGERKAVVSDIVAKVAERLYVQWSNHRDYGKLWSDLSDEEHTDWINIARNAIEGMRKPTPDMMEAYKAGIKQHGHMCQVVWDMMIDAALEEGRP